MPSSLIDRSFYGNSRQKSASSQVDGLPSGPAGTFSTLRMSIFEGLEAHPAVDAHPFLPHSFPHGIEGLTRHPDAPKPFSLSEVFGEPMSRAASPLPIPSVASQFAESLAKQSSSLSAKSSSFAERVYDEYYEDDSISYCQEDYDEENMADDEYYPSPPSSRTASSFSTRTSRFLNSSNFTPTHAPEPALTNTHSRKSKFLSHTTTRQPEIDSHKPVWVPVEVTPSEISELSYSEVHHPASVLSADSSCDSMTSDSDPHDGNSSSLSEPEEPRRHAFRTNHHLPPSIFIPSPANFKAVLDDGLKSAMTEGSHLVSGLRSAVGDAFTEVSTFIGQGMSRFSEFGVSASGFSDWEPSPASEESPKSLISKILFDFFAARQPPRQIV